MAPALLAVSEAFDCSASIYGIERRASGREAGLELTIERQGLVQGNNKIVLAL